MKIAIDIFAALLLTAGVIALARWYINRRIDRRIAGYQNDLIQKHFDEVQNMYRQTRAWRHDYHNHIQTMKAHLALGHLQELDACIAKHCDTWSIDRLSKVDLSILRLAVAEMHFMENIPYKVAVSEAVELAKKYSEEKAPQFINGILRAVAEDYLAEQA